MNITVNTIFSDCFQQFSEKCLVQLSEDEIFKYEGQLYHYTSLENFKMMIDNGSILATSIYMMNDPNELKNDYEKILKIFFGRFLNNGQYARKYDDIYTFPAFVFSLTEHEDSMYFWDKYGNNHKGIRIGFNPEAIINYWKVLGDISVVLVPVIYKKDDSNYVGKYSKYFIEFKNELFSKLNTYYETNEITDSDKDNLSYYAALISSMIKMEYWRVEEEWRIICNTGGYVYDKIVGVISNGIPTARLKNDSEKTLSIFTNTGQGNIASKNILKIGSLAGNKDYIEYFIKLLFKSKTKTNFYNDVLTQSKIEIR